ncbi:SymE family type I addiction module toxin [Serratia fonticola]|uniref:SymE family type I addiction module toxin n=1 Tax=Serratia fonticola TaxID=47917 RepID=UPI001C45DFAA|nr:SymE family type I addiction module toxin [Serratia fonticola]QXN64055.1 type I toxin-antitoxin system SymE family toxin [Serratia fonticola]QXN64064.1 type I toxin-antitoxin system SymE family toxin [Serratia fonticola]
MAKQHHKSEPATPQALRHFKVGYVSRRHESRTTRMTTYYSRTPSLHLKGDWLEEAGFGTDTPVRVAIEPGQLIIRVVTQ